MSKMKIKEDLLKMLRDEMMDDDKHESMESLMDGKMKATIVADDEEGLIEGAKKIPEALSKADEFKKARLGCKKKS